MLFTGVRETLAKLAQFPFGVVRAEEELVDPAKVLRVSLKILHYNGLQSIFSAVIGKV